MQRDVLGSEWGGRGCPCAGQLFNKTAEFQHQWLMMPHMHSLCNLLMQKESKSFCKGLKTKYWWSVFILSTHIWHLSDYFALLLRSVTASPPRRASTCDTFNSWQISYNLQLFPLFLKIVHRYYSDQQIRTNRNQRSTDTVPSLLWKHSAAESCPSDSPRKASMDHSKIHECSCPCECSWKCEV